MAAKLDRAAGIRDLTAGTLVHRLFQFGIVPGGVPDAGEEAYALTLLKPEERATLEDVDATVAAAVAAWRAMHGREDVRRSLPAAAGSTKSLFHYWSRQLPPSTGPEMSPPSFAARLTA